MSEADKDGRIAEWLSDRLAILGMEMHESVREAIAHDHRHYVPGCFRCDLSRDEVDDV